MLFEASEQIYGVADCPPHEGSGTNLAYQTSSLGGGLAAWLLVAFDDLYVCLAGACQMVSGTQAPDAAPRIKILAWLSILSPLRIWTASTSADGSPPSHDLALRLTEY